MALRRPASRFIILLERAALTSPRTNSKLFSIPFHPRPRPNQRCRQQQLRTLSTSHPRLDAPKSSDPPSSPATPTSYTYSDISSLASTPSPHRILIDVREPGELHQTGRIPSSRNLPLTSSPDFMFLPAEEFEDRYGFPRPGKEDEVIFYCKAGVRSRAAARLAQQADFGGKVSEYPGSWLEWEKNGGEVER